MILFTGKGTSGSWQIRGAQIAKALDGKAAPLASLEDCKAAEIVVAVKRVPDSLLANIRKSGKPWAWDVVDAYPQPQCSRWSRDDSLRWLSGEVARLKPDMVIFPNQRMADDYGSGEVIYHHHRPGIAVNPIRDRIRAVGYEGSAKYIEGWSDTIKRECQKRGAEFIVNPSSLADVDVVLAVRGDGWNGYPQERWKSNVKLANAHGSGAPFVGAKEDGYLETQTGAECWVESANDVGRALDALESKRTRLEVQKQFLCAAYTVEKAARRYREVLCKLRS